MGKSIAEKEWARATAGQYKVRKVKRGQKPKVTWGHVTRWQWEFEGIDGASVYYQGVTRRAALMLLFASPAAATAACELPLEQRDIKRAILGLHGDRNAYGWDLPNQLAGVAA